MPKIDFLLIKQIVDICDTSDLQSCKPQFSVYEPPVDGPFRIIIRIHTTMFNNQLAWSLDLLIGPNVVHTSNVEEVHRPVGFNPILMKVDAFEVPDCYYEQTINIIHKFILEYS